MHRRDVNGRLIWCLVPTYQANQRLRMLRRWRQLVPPERWYLCTKLHGFTSQKTEMTTDLTMCLGFGSFRDNTCPVEVAGGKTLLVKVNFAL